MGSDMFLFSRLQWAAALYPNIRNKKKNETVNASFATTQFLPPTLHFEAEKRAMASLPDQQHSLDWGENRDWEDWEAVIMESHDVWLEPLDKWQH